MIYIYRNITTNYTKIMTYYNMYIRREESKTSCLYQMTAFYRFTVLYLLSIDKKRIDKITQNFKIKNFACNNNSINIVIYIQ